MAIFKLLVLSYMPTTLYISFRYSNNINKFYVKIQENTDLSQIFRYTGNPNTQMVCKVEM